MFSYYMVSISDVTVPLLVVIGKKKTNVNVHAEKCTWQYNGGLWYELHAQVMLLGHAGRNSQYFSLKNTRSLIWDLHEAFNLQFAISINRNSNK